jgi:hypothetical protein
LIYKPPLLDGGFLGLNKNKLPFINQNHKNITNFKNCALGIDFWTWMGVQFFEDIF